MSWLQPQVYLLGAVPVVLSGMHDRLEYNITAAGGVQHIVQDPSPIYPASSALIQPLLQPLSASQRASQASIPACYDGQTSTGPNYYTLVRVSYHLAPQWYLDAFATANNARDFASRSAGITLKFLIGQQRENRSVGSARWISRGTARQMALLHEMADDRKRAISNDLIKAERLLQQNRRRAVSTMAMRRAHIGVKRTLQWHLLDRLRERRDENDGPATESGE